MPGTGGGWVAWERGSVRVVRLGMLLEPSSLVTDVGWDGEGGGERGGGEVGGEWGGWKGEGGGEGGGEWRGWEGPSEVTMASP